MIRSLRESKAKLSELVELSSRGQDVLITVRGKVKARLTRAGQMGGADDRRAWVAELRALQKRQRRRSAGPTIEQVLTETREDRV